MTDLEAVTEIANQVEIARKALKEAMRLADEHSLSFDMPLLDNSTEYVGKGFKHDWEESSSVADAGEWQNSSSHC